MKSIILLFFMFVNLPLLSQSIIWENEIDIGDPTVNGLFNMIIDSDSNIVCVLNPGGYTQVISHFCKINMSGELLSYRQLHYGYLLMAHDFYETDFGYRVLCGTAKRYGGGFAEPEANTFPMIFNLNHDGDTINTNLPYNFDIDSIRNDYSLSLNSSLPTTSILNGKFYNICSILKKIPAAYDSTYWYYTKMIIFSCFNEKGELIFRKEFDTINAAGNFYDARILKNNQDQTFFALVNHDYMTMNGKKSKHLFFELDSTGTILKKFRMEYDYLFWPSLITKLRTGEYIIYHDSKLMVISQNGEILKDITIENKFEGIGYRYLSQTPDDGVILAGNMMLKENTDPDQSEYRLYFIILDKEFNKIIEYEWYDHIYLNLSFIKNIIFLDDNSMIIAGPKDRYKIWMAKISLKPVSVGEGQENIKFSISPNPASDYIDINLEKWSSSSVWTPSGIQIYNSLGECVMSVGAIHELPLQRIDISALSAGLYFININNGKDILTGSFILLR